VRLRRPPSVEERLLLDLANWVMRIDAKVDRILLLLGEEDGEEEEDS
jgi:hypothetical protein